MGSRERRERERQELRRRILDAARELFVVQGYEAVTMRKIAQRIEYSPTAIYLHFADKEAVIRELCATDFRSLAAELRKIGRVADPIARLRASGKAYAEFAISHPYHYRLMFMTPHPPHTPDEIGVEQGNPEEDAYAFLETTVEAAIAARRFRPELRDAELIAQLIWAGVHGVVSLRIAKHTDPWVDWRGERQTVEAMIDTLVRGLERPRLSRKR